MKTILRLFKLFERRESTFLFFVLVMAGWSGLAHAGETSILDRMKGRVSQIVQAKDAGAIGERPDGLLGFVKSDVDSTTKRVVDEENSDRQAIYTSRAAEQGQALDVFMRVMGDSRMDQEKSGRFIQKSDGSWQKKK